MYGIVIDQFIGLDCLVIKGEWAKAAEIALYARALATDVAQIESDLRWEELAAIAESYAEREDAKDAVQEAMLAAFTHLHQFQGRADHG